MDIDPTTTKYMIHATISAEGVIKKPDVVGAIFGQTEGLLGDELDLRDLQRSNRMGRIEVDVKSTNGKTEGNITMPSSLNKVETAILAAGLETIERIGPCSSKIGVTKIEDVRMTKRQAIIERAKVLLQDITSTTSSLGGDLTESVRKSVQIEEITSWGRGEHPAGPNIGTADNIIIVEGRSDILNLLKYGIKNTVAVGGTNIPDDIKELTKERIVTAFVDGDRGGDLIIAELLQTAEVDFICKAPPNTEVEELTQKQIMKSLRSTIPTEQYIEMFDLDKSFKRNNNAPVSKKSISPRKSAAGSKADPKKSPRRNSKENGFQKGGRGRARPAETTRERRPARTVSEAPARRPARSRAAAVELPGKIQSVVTSIEELQQKGMGYFFDGSEAVLKEMKTGEIVELLAQSEKSTVDTIVFGGLVPQKLLDTAAEKGVKTIFASRTRPDVKKLPDNVKVHTKD